MALFDFLLFVAVGCVVGFFAGMFGIGGGILIVPVLIFSYEQSGIPWSVLTHIAIGTSLFVIVFASLTSAYQHAKQRNVDWRSVFVLGFSSAVTALAATRLAAWLSGNHLRIVFALIVMVSAIKMLIESEAQAQKKLEFLSKPGIPGLMGVGLAAGIVAALAGVGGAVVTIPMMYYLLNMPLKLAIGTSSATIVITALFSVVGYILNGIGRAGLPEWSFGFVDLQRGAALAVGTVLMARVGAYVSFKTHPFRLRKLFAVFVILVSIYILVR
ncbi:MAG TPA: sulfite exporter TauE/SafE family protein [Thermodesulfobacteriota bacterium]|nr:sulfite exporter TauE/SafE family protein [Thermodesulfobacteriota bacterium]